MCVSLPPSLASNIVLVMFVFLMCVCVCVCVCVCGGGGGGGGSEHDLPRIPISLYCHMAKRSIAGDDHLCPESI